MKGYEALALLAEGKKVTTINGLIGIEYYTLRNNTEIIGIDEDGEVKEANYSITVQDIFVGDDWIEYESETVKKNKEYHKIMTQVKGAK